MNRLLYYTTSSRAARLWGTLAGSTALVWVTCNNSDHQNNDNSNAYYNNNNSNKNGNLFHTIQNITRLEQRFRVKGVYNVQDVLGQGAYGVVYEAIRKKDGRSVALKRMSRQTTPDTAFEREVNILSHLSRVRGGHAHICGYYDQHRDDRHYYLAMELLKGGELMDHLIQNGPYSEGMAATFLRQFAEALVFLHTSGVAHADLKLENLMLSDSNTQTAKLKVVDFGSAQLVSEMNATPDQQIPGTTAYNPPEYFVKDATLSPKADVWAAGCIVYILVTGTHPFDKHCRATDQGIARELASLNKHPKRIRQMVFDERVRGLSPSCVELLEKLLEPNPAKRLTSYEFLSHPWVQGLTASWETMHNSHRKLEAYYQATFRKEILKKFRVVGTLSEDNLREMFDALDLDGNGTLEPEEVAKALEELGLQSQNKRLHKDLFASIDLDKSGLIHWDEFKTIMRQHYPSGPGLRREYWQDRFQSNVLQSFESKNIKVTKERLRQMFDAMDLDGNGILDAHELRVVLRTTGQNDERISQMVAAADRDQDGGITWDEFWRVMSRSRDE